MPSQALRAHRPLTKSFDPGAIDTTNRWLDDAEPPLGCTEHVNQEARLCVRKGFDIYGLYDAEEDAGEMPQDQCEDEGSEEGLF